VSKLVNFRPQIKGERKSSTEDTVAMNKQRLLSRLTKDRNARAKYLLYLSSKIILPDKPGEFNGQI